MALLCAFGRPAFAPAATIGRVPAGARVVRVTINGEKAIGEGTLRRLMRLNPTHRFVLFPRYHEFYRDFLRADVQAIASYYVQQGFPDVTVADTVRVRPKSDPPEVEITLTISEGERETLAAVRLEGVTATTPEKLRESMVLHEGKPFTDLMVKVDRETIKNWYYEHGFPWVTVEAGQEVPREVTFLVHEHARAYFGEVSLAEGLDTLTTEPRVILRQVPFRPGDLFQSSQLAEYERRLYATGLFSNVHFSLPAESQVDSAHQFSVRVAVTERPFRYVEGGLDYDAVGLLVSTAKLGTHNIGGTARQLEGAGELGLSVRNLSKGSGHIISSSSLSLAGVEPWFLFPRTQASLGPVYDYRRVIGNELDRTSKVGMVFTLQRDLARKSRVGAKLSEFYLWHRPPPDSTGVQLVEGSENRLIDTSFDGDFRDNIFDPTRGTAIHGQLQYAGLGGKTNYLKGVAEQSWFVSLRSRMVLGVRVRGGTIGPLGTVAITDPGCGLDEERALLSRVNPLDRFRLGGATSVRGYAEQAIGAANPKDPTYPCALPIQAEFGQYNAGGLAELLLNIELRFRLSGRLGMAAFLDGGNVWAFTGDIAAGRLLPTTHRLEDNDMKYSAGIGIRVATPVGPFRLDYARKVGIPSDFAVGTPDRAPDRLQFALGSSF